LSIIIGFIGFHQEFKTIDILKPEFEKHRLAIAPENATLGSAD
jgi:hypothetical protein